ncbi:MAG TPA: S-formylglutathione hydrolase [Sphingomonadaceae bacterium]|nr:S-formylglutathione hydrolase [Sphingomonadaceae bacterium]
METLSTFKSFGGTQGVYRHASRETGTPMTFAVYLPPQAAKGARLPVVWFLSGLTCTHANVMDKGGYQRVCAELGLILVAPDTSPRGAGVPDADGYDFGQGAGFYLDATEPPWAANFRMASYILDELPRLIAERFPADMDAQGITGHSMGGHGALTLALRNPDRFRSVSAFAPIVAPSQVPWGEKAFRFYLGEDRSAWHAHDAVSLIGYGARLPELLVDQGTADNFLADQLRPHLLADACRAAGLPLTLRMQDGYDHGYGFVSTFIEDHLRWHAQRLGC